MKKIICIMLIISSMCANGANRLKIVNAKIINPHTTIESGTILIEDGKIIYCGSENKPWDKASVIDAKGNNVSAGFIDVHCHGGGNYDFSDLSVEAMLGAAMMHAKHGTTLIYPTTASCTNDILFETFDIYRKANKANDKGAKFGGVHIEGGYFNDTMKGGQDSRYIKNPTPEDYNAILAKGGDIITRWSFAPELPGAKGLCEELSKRGIQMSMAHTAALYEEAMEAFGNGVNSITHFYSLTSSVTRRNALRYAGVIEAGYQADDIYVETIGDGIHLPESLLRLIVKVKPHDKIVGVTDAMRGAGMPDGETILGSIKDGVPAIIEDGVAKVLDRSSFAGSVCTMNRVVKTYLNKTDAGINQAVQFATLNPARLMGIDKIKGSIHEGKDADIVIFDNNVDILTTIIGGNIIYQK